VLGVLPFFHSFGYTVTLWLPLVVGFAAAYHPNPIDAKTIGEMAAKYGRHCWSARPHSAPRMCASVSRSSSRRSALPSSARSGCASQSRPAFKTKFGVDLIEATAAPRWRRSWPSTYPPCGHRIAAGTVGRPLPHLRQGRRSRDRRRPADRQEGLLLVTGPNQMRGYFAEPDLTREALRDGCT